MLITRVKTITQYYKHVLYINLRPNEERCAKITLYKKLLLICRAQVH